MDLEVIPQEPGTKTGQIPYYMTLFLKRFHYLQDIYQHGLDGPGHFPAFFISLIFPVTPCPKETLGVTKLQ